MVTLAGAPDLNVEDVNFVHRAFHLDDSRVHYGEDGGVGIDAVPNLRAYLGNNSRNRRRQGEVGKAPSGVFHCQPRGSQFGFAQGQQQGVRGLQQVCQRFIRLAQTEHCILDIHLSSQQGSAEFFA